MDHYETFLFVEIEQFLKIEYVVSEPIVQLGKIQSFEQDIQSFPGCPTLQVG